MLAKATDTSVWPVLRHYVWNEPSGRPAPETAVARVRRGQIYVALVGTALWLGGLLGGILAEGGTVVWCLGIVSAVGLGTLLVRPQESVVLTASLIITGVVVLVATRAQEAGSPLGTGWFDTAAVSLIGVATLRRALTWAIVIGVTSLTTWTYVVATATVPGGWRTAVVWSVSSVSLGLAAAVMAAIIRAGARRLDRTLASAQQAFTEEELQQAEAVEFDAAARVLHDSVINTLAAIGRGVPADAATIQSRCRQDLELIDATLADEALPQGDPDPVATARARAHALGLDLSVTGHPEALSQVSAVARDAIGGAVAESLLNAAKHARVHTVTLDVAAPVEDIVVVTVSDEGPGWSGVLVPGGGVDQSILARCREAGVEAWVDTSPGRGTTVSLSVVQGESASNGEAVVRIGTPRGSFMSCRGPGTPVMTNPRGISASRRFDVTRADADRLLSFGIGAHYCLGSQFARRELRSFLRRMVDQIEVIEPDGTAQWAASHFVSGVKHLPIRYRFR